MSKPAPPLTAAFVSRFDSTESRQVAVRTLIPTARLVILPLAPSIKSVLANDGTSTGSFGGEDLVTRRTRRLALQLIRHGHVVGVVDRMIHGQGFQVAVSDRVRQHTSIIADRTTTLALDVHTG